MKKITITATMVLLMGTLIFALSYNGKYGFMGNSGVEAQEEEEDIVQEDVGQPTNDNPWDELEKLVTNYYGNGNIAYGGLVKVIDDNGPAESVLEAHSFVFRLFGKGFHYVIDSVDFIRQGRYVAVIDNRSQLISLSATDDGQQLLPLFDMDTFRKMLEEQKASMLVTGQDNEKILTIDSIMHPQIQGYRIHYDPDTYKINRMVIGMLRLYSLDEAEQVITDTGEQQDSNTPEAEENHKGPDIYTYYLDITYNEAAPAGNNAEPLSRFFKQTGDHFELKERYKSYQFVNTEEAESDLLMQTEADQ